MNKTSILTAVLATSTLLSTAAFAAPQTKSGEIKSIDAAKNELVLSGGDVFELPKAFKVDTVKAGEKVKITYEMKDGKMAATHVKPEK